MIIKFKFFPYQQPCKRMSKRRKQIMTGGRIPDLRFTIIMSFNCDVSDNLSYSNLPCHTEFGIYEGYVGCYRPDIKLATQGLRVCATT